MNQEILNYSNKHKENYNKVLNLINKYNKICVFRHRVPDFDALGTQLGLYYFLKDNFPNKDIICVGDDHNKFTPKLYEKMQIIPDEWFDDKFLSIVVDVSDKSRVSDDRFIKAQEIVVFDHHPYVKDYDCLAIIDTEIAAASELVADFMIYSNLKISEKSAYYLYSGLVDGLIIDNLNINVSDDNDSRESRVGGLFSYIADSAILKNCYITGNINATNINYVGGLVGTTYMDEITDINYPNYHLINCSFNGNINHTFSDSETDLSRTNIATGGLIGIVDITYTHVYISNRNKMKGELINYPKSSVSAQIVGPQYVGGLSGIVYIGDISNSFGEKYFDYNFDGFNFNGELKSTSGYKTDNIVGKVYSYSGLINDL